MKNASGNGTWHDWLLSDLFSIKHGYAFDGKYFTVSGQYVLLTPGNFYDAGGFKYKDQEKFFVGEVDEEYILNQGDLLVAMTEQAEGLLGSSALIPESGKYLHNQRLGLVTGLQEDRVDKRFLYYLFNSRQVRTQIRASATGTKVRHTSPSRIGEVKVRIPGVMTQRKVATVVSAYDDLIRNNTRRIAVLEEMAQSLYWEWFVRFRFPGHENVPLVPSPLGDIPQGWNLRPLSSIAQVNARSIKKGREPEVINYIDIASVSPGKIDAIQPMPYSDAPGRARRIVRHGDIIWSTVRPNRKSYSLIIDPLPNTIASTGFAVISGTSAPFTFLYQAVTTEDFVGYLVNHATGSAYPAVLAGDFDKAEILVPTDDLMNKFHEVAADFYALKDRLERKNLRLRATRDLLLPKLISGQLDVEHLDIDAGEPLTV